MSKPLSRYDKRRRRYPARRTSPPVDLTKPIEYSDEYRHWLRDMLADIRSERRHDMIRGFDIGVN